MHSAVLIALVALVAGSSALPPLAPVVVAHGLHHAPSADNVQTQINTDLRGVARDVSNLAGAQVTLAANAANAAAADQAALINSENVQAVQNARQVVANRINNAAAISVNSAISANAAINNQAIQAAQAALAPHQPGDIPVASIAGVAPVPIGVAGVAGLPIGVAGVAGLPIGVAGIPVAGIPIATNYGGLVGVAGHGLVGGAIIG